MNEQDLLRILSVQLDSQQRLADTVTALSTLVVQQAKQIAVLSEEMARLSKVVHAIVERQPALPPSPPGAPH